MLTLLIYVIYVVLAIALCLVVHEGSHWLVAKLFNWNIHFEIKWHKLFNLINIPRAVWEMPSVTNATDQWKQKFLAISGFSGEAIFSFLFASFGWGWMAVVFIIHFTIYPFYSIDNFNDFKFLG